MPNAPQAGDRAPDFEMPTDADAPAKLAELKGRIVVLYFYPKDDTPGCTSEAQGFTAAAADFRQLGAEVIGVSKDSPKSHGKFRRKYDLDVVLAADEELAVAQAYGVWGEKTLYGRTYMGIERATFLIDGNGVVRRVWRKVSVKGHVDEVLAATRDLRQQED